MYNIKLKSVPNKAKTGSQLDYSLVDRNTLFLKPNTPVDSDVKNTMGAVPRDKANIEAEGGETIVGDINNDGYLEHQTIVGKRHTQGGVPLNVPEGSFIFSDTKKMIIKDPEVLAIFGMKPNKAGYTPAEIAKKYNINDFIAILKDETKDKYSKETAQIMLQSNLKKLGMLALIQESMKGFPDGIPAIAESVMGQMQGGQESLEQEAPEQEVPQEEMMEEEQPMQRYGGSQLPKAQDGKNKDVSLFGDIKRSFNFNMDNVRKKGLLTHLGEWWQEKDETPAYKQRVAKQKQDEIKKAEVERLRAERDRLRAEAQRLEQLTNDRKAKKAEQDKQAYLKNHKFTGETIYRHNQPYKVGTADPSRLGLLSDESAFVFPVEGFNEDGEPTIDYMSKLQLYDALHRTQYSKSNYKNPSAHAWEKVQSRPIISERQLNKNLKIVTGDDLTIGTNMYKVINPWGENSKKYKESWKAVRDTFDDTNGIIYVKNLTTGENEFLEGEDITDAYNLDKNIVQIKRGSIYRPAMKNSADSNNAATKAPTTDLTQTKVDTTAGTANQEAQKRAAAVRDAAAKAQAEAARVQQQQAAGNSQNQNQERVRVRIKTPPAQNATPSSQMINGIEVTSDPNLAYGGNIHQYAYGGGMHQYKFQGDVGGSTVTAPQTPAPTDPTPKRKIVKYTWGEKTQKMYAIDEEGKAFETPYTKVITREKALDPKTKKNTWKYYAAFPEDMPSKDRAALVDNIEEAQGLGVVGQHGNQRINPNNPYKSFYGNARPQDYEDRIVRKNLGDQATDAMDEITKRKKAFEFLGIKGVQDVDLKDAARLYNDPHFFNEQFMPAFESKLPAGTYRPQMGNDRKLGFEHLKAYTVAPAAKKEDEVVDENINIDDVKKPVQTPSNIDTGMWGQDKNNILLQMSAPTNKYFPTMATHNYVTPGYALMDYTGQVRGIQQQTAALQNQAANTMAGNVALAASSGIAGQSMDKVADVIGNVDNANVGIVNTFSNNNTGIINKAADMNQAAKQTYLAQLSRMLNNNDKERFFKRSRVVGAINNGLTGLQGRNYMKAMYPNVDVDPWTGVRTIHGNATPALNDDGSFVYNPYVNPYTAGSGMGSVDADSLYDTYMKQPGMTHQQAVDRVNLRLKSTQIKSGRQNPYVYGSSRAPSNYPGAYGATADNAYGYDDPYDS
jgi:hypothetical protein